MNPTDGLLVDDFRSPNGSNTYIIIGAITVGDPTAATPETVAIRVRVMARALVRV